MPSTGQVSRSGFVASIVTGVVLVGITVVLVKVGWIVTPVEAGRDRGPKTSPALRVADLLVAMHFRSRNGCPEWDSNPHAPKGGRF